MESTLFWIMEVTPGKSFASAYFWASRVPLVFDLPFLSMKMLHFFEMLESMVNQVNFTLCHAPPHPRHRCRLCYLLDCWRRALYLLKPGGGPSSLLLATGASAFCPSPFAAKASASHCFMRAHQYHPGELSLKACA